MFQLFQRPTCPLLRDSSENIHKNPIVEKDVLDIFKYNGRSINELLAEMNN